MPNRNNWVRRVERLMHSFANQYSSVYSKKEREISASFEIGCFISLVNFYENRRYTVTIENLKNNEFKYLTTPSGNPENFSFVKLEFNNKVFEIRQQIRIKSHLAEDTNFTPDIVVLKRDPELEGIYDTDYYQGRRQMFYVTSDQVIAAHECKSLPPFPELLISFLGMVIAGHDWIKNLNDRSMVTDNGLHLAPTLFVGGSARHLHLRMVESLKNTLPINIIVGMHYHHWDIANSMELTLIDDPY